MKAKRTKVSRYSAGSQVLVGFAAELAAAPELGRGLLPAAAERIGNGYARVLEGSPPPHEGLALAQAEERRAGVRGRRAETLIKSGRGAFVRAGEAWRAAGMPGDRPPGGNGHWRAGLQQGRPTRQNSVRQGTRRRRGRPARGRSAGYSTRGDAVEHGLATDERAEAAS